MPPPDGVPASSDPNNYNFIISPEKQKSSSGPGSKFGLTKNPFITKIILLVGGAIVFMILVTVVLGLVFGNRTNTDTFVALAQREQEILRISALGKDAVDQQIKSAGVSAQLSVKSHQNSVLAYLATHKREVKSAELALKKDQSADNKLKLAKDTSAFDAAYAEVMRAQLTTYAGELKNAYDNEPKSIQRKDLERKYNDVQMLLKMWPTEQNQ